MSALGIGVASFFSSDFLSVEKKISRKARLGPECLQDKVTPKKKND